MNQNKLKKFFEPLKETNGAKTSSVSRTMALLSGAFLFSLQLLSSRADAQILAQHSATGCGGTCTTIVTTTNATATSLLTTGLGSASPCSSGGLSGLTNNGVTTYSPSNGRVYFDLSPVACHQLNITGFKAKLRRSNAGLRKVRFAYSTNGGSTWTTDLTDKAPQNTSCGGGSTVFSWNGTLSITVPDGSSVRFALFPFDPQSSGGVIQFNDITIEGTVTGAPSACAGTPDPVTVTGGTTVCAGIAPGTLTASGFSSGCGISYQWQQSCGGGPFTNITGGTNTTYVVPTSTPSSPEICDYRLVTTCSNSGLSSTSSTTTVTVNPQATVSPISVTTGTVTPSLYVGNTATLSNATSGGVWTSSPSTPGTIDGSTGVITGLNSGSTNVTYTVSNIYGCDNFATLAVDVLRVYPEGTLFDYVGANGTSVNTIAYSTDETVSNLSTTGLSSATPCTTGGLSGLTMSTSVVNYNPTTGPKAFVTITPVSGKSISLFKFGAACRRSGTGADSVRLAYSLDGGSTWIDQGFSSYQDAGSCGSNEFFRIWALPAPVRSATSIMVAVFPHHPASSGGTFQVNRFFANGQITSTATCTTTPDAGVITPVNTTVCDSGYFDGTYIGLDSVGYSYQWTVDTSAGFPTGGGFDVNIPGQNNVYYYSGVHTTPGTLLTYRVVRTCSAGGSTATSADATFEIVPPVTPITGIPSYVIIGTPVTVNCTPATASGKWFSSNSALATVDSVNLGEAELNGLIAGTAVITYRVIDAFSCRSVATVNVIHPNTLSVYLGTDGTSTAVTPLLAGSSTSTLTATSGFGSGTFCGTGGLSGLTINPSVVSYAPTGDNIFYTFTVPTGKDIRLDNVFATVRASGTGAANYRVAYEIDGSGTWVENTSDLFSDIESCGRSVSEGAHDVVPASALNTVKVGIFPYGSGSLTGTFQVNSINMTGIACDENGPIQVTDASPIHDLNGSTYNFDCTGTFGFFTLSITGESGTWASLNPTIADVNPATGELDIFTGNTGTVTIQYTNNCNIVTTATFDVVSTGYNTCDGSTALPRQAVYTANEVAAAREVSIYPNPTTSELHIAANEKVNVSVLSIDGRTLMTKVDAKSINVSKLATGVYMVQVRNEKGAVIKTAKFTKQ